MHVLLIVLLIQYVTAKNVTLTTDVENTYVNGARVRNLGDPNVQVNDNKWNLVVATDSDEWGLWINMDNTWGYHPTLPSQLIMTISGNSISVSDCDMLLSITDGLDSQTLSRYFSMIVRLDGKGVNQIGPGCDTNLQSPNQTLFTGDVYLVMADSPPPGGINRACRPAYIDPTHNCEYEEMGPASTAAQWPFTFTINNYPAENRMTVTFKGNGYTQTTCGFVENIPLNEGHNIYITGQSVGDNYEISSIYLQYKLLATTTAVPTTSPTTNTPTKTPTINPSKTPTTNIPTNIPTKTPTTTPTHSPVTIAPTTNTPTTNEPSLHPTTSNPTTTKPTPVIPTTATPTTSHPTTSNPTTITPTTNIPTNYPTTSTPTTHIPTTTQPTFNPFSPTTNNPTNIPTTMQPSLNPSQSPTSKTTTRKPTNEGEHIESTFSGTDDGKLEVLDSDTLGVTSILMITIISILILILFCCIILCIKKLKHFYKLKRACGEGSYYSQSPSKQMIIHYPNAINMNSNAEGGHRISIVNARPEGGSHTIPVIKNNEPGLNSDNDMKDDDEDVMDGIEETQFSPGNLPKPPARKLSPKEKKGMSNDEFIDAIVQQAQPPQIELNEVKRRQRIADNESEPLMDENNHTKNNESLDYINGDMVIKGDETIGGIEKKLNDEDDYDEGKSTYKSMKNNIINENEEMDINVNDMKHKMNKYKQKGKKKESDDTNHSGSSYIIHGSESETKK